MSPKFSDMWKDWAHFPLSEHSEHVTMEVTQNAFGLIMMRVGADFAYACIHPYAFLCCLLCFADDACVAASPVHSMAMFSQSQC